MKKSVLALALLAAVGNAHAIVVVAARPVVVPHVSVPVAPHVVEPIAAPHATVVAHKTTPTTAGVTSHSPTYTPTYTPVHSHSSAASYVEASKSGDTDRSTYVIATFVGLTLLVLTLTLTIIPVFF